MVKERNIFAMEMFIKENMSMVNQKVMENIFGLICQLIKVSN